jgi:hypothetical protein
MSGASDPLAEAAFAELSLIVSGRKPWLAPDQWAPVAYAATAPTGGVCLGEGPLRQAFERNIDYLNDWFRRTQGATVPADPRNWWETCLYASSEGRMLGAAAHTLRWGDRADMRRIVDTVVGIVKARQRADGYCLPYDEKELNGSLDAGRDERRNYDRVNLTRGMVAAGLAGNRDALPVMRKFYDWFNASPYLPRSLAGPFDGTSDKINDTTGPSEHGTGHNSCGGYDGHLLMYFSTAGRPEDLVAVERYFVQDWFLEASRRQDARSLSHYPYHLAHSYVLLIYKAWLDHYRATGAAKYLDAAKSAWQIVHDHFLHLGGSLAICEHLYGSYPPDSYYLRVDPEHHTGETCGSVFWADINHRLLQFFPAESRYADEMERSIFNCVLACQDERGHIRYHSRLIDRKQEALSVSTCCEVMGSQFIASLPQYVFSVAPDGVYVNLFASATVTCPTGTVRMKTDFPFGGKVEIAVYGEIRLRIRMPGWADHDIPIRVNGDPTVSGSPGRYVTLDRVWKPGDTVSFELPMTLRTVRYTGLDQPPQYARHGLLCGPILMGLVGADDLDIPATDLADRLEPMDGRPLHFTVSGREGVHYKPYWQIQGEPFTCFPTLR